MQGFEKLPREILEYILQHVPTQDLISFRLVNQSWHAVATLLCRRRHLTLKQFRVLSCKTIDQLLQDMKNTSNLPWSSFTATYCPQDDKTERFLRVFGPNILRLQTNYFHSWNLYEVFKHTVNLHSLFIMGHNKLLNYSSVALPKLKQLDIGPENLDFLEHLVNSGSPLRQLKLQGIPCEKELLKIIKTIVNISEIIISTISEVPMSTFNILALNKLNIKQLKFSLVDPGTNPVSDYYASLENFLANLPNLQELNIAVQCMRYLHSSTLFKFPRLRNLKRLEMEFEDFELVKLFLHRLDSSHFPVLTTVKLGVTSVYCEGNSFFKMPINFNLVTELDVAGSDYDPWHKMFPNLKKLKISVESFYAFKNIFKNIHLEELYMNIDIVEYEDDTKSYYCRAMQYFLFRHDELAAEPILSSKGVPPPNLKSLTALKTLEIYFQNDWHLPSVYAIPKLYLLSMQRLNHLTICGLKMSANCQAKLETCHTKFTFRDR